MTHRHSLSEQNDKEKYLSHPLVLVEWCIWSINVLFSNVEKWRKLFLYWIEWKEGGGSCWRRRIGGLMVIKTTLFNSKYEIIDQTWLLQFHDEWSYIVNTRHTFCIWKACTPRDDVNRGGLELFKRVHYDPTSLWKARAELQHVLVSMVVPLQHGLYHVHCL